jgi:hypothetical protein
MGHLKHAKFAGSDSQGVWLDCGDGVTCRIEVRSEWIVRVLFIRGGRLRQPTTWMALGASTDSLAIGRASRDGLLPNEDSQNPHSMRQSLEEFGADEVVEADVPWGGRPRLQPKLEQGSPASALFEMEESPGVIRVHTAAISLIVSLSPFHLSWCVVLPRKIVKIDRFV